MVEYEIIDAGRVGCWKSAEETAQVITEQKSVRYGRIVQNPWSSMAKCQIWTGLYEKKSRTPQKAVHMWKAFWQS